MRSARVLSERRQSWRVWALRRGGFPSHFHRGPAGLGEDECLTTATQYIERDVQDRGLGPALNSSAGPVIEL